MNIPKLHYISQGNTPEEHLENIQKACIYGAELVQLRLKNRDENTLLKTAEKAREITGHFQTRLIINDHYKVAKIVNADGVHLGKTDACPLEAREYLGKWFMIGGTANTLEDCQILLSKKVDYIGLGPFRFTKTKDNLSPILGLESYQSILSQLQSETPIIAIGGIIEQDIPELLQTGIYGIAMSGAITGNFNNIQTFNKLLNASATFEQRHTF
ncbi:thiamine phosphate synthase [Aestuariibaculum lutulentum]|uniref:Thiamine-phosphate synthase n=1 Tax=Aestuariibaculum lutulentum TaxID=2920935 RepID=A0ABS9RGU3_9FLAO|nr:thiamine phosphate synthase [Aestuariibaculum lutulentum]MCH4552168.1 thiamine phosphate synthase [Aestuariibaculum lutulentum]